MDRTHDGCCRIVREGVGTERQLEKRRKSRFAYILLFKHFKKGAGQLSLSIIGLKSQVQY